jgi:hypothetical protein
MIILIGTTTKLIKLVNYIRYKICSSDTIKVVESWNINGEACNRDGRRKMVYQSLVGKHEENRNVLEQDVERKNNLKDTGMRIWTRSI